MTTEIVIGVVSSLLATALLTLWNRLRHLSVKDLMKELVDVKNTRKKQQKILKLINWKLMLMDWKLFKFPIKKDYIQTFKLNNRRIEELFLDICVQNDIEPTSIICTKFLGNDSRTKRDEYYKIKEGQKPTQQVVANTEEV